MLFNAFSLDKTDKMSTFRLVGPSLHKDVIQIQINDLEGMCIKKHQNA